MRSMSRCARALVLACSTITAYASDADFSRGNAFDQRAGEALYRSICQGCHMPDGRGAQGAGAYPALASNPRAASADYLATVVLQGRRNMPSFARQLDDAQVAEVVTYVRSNLNEVRDAPMTAERVASLRSSSSK